MGKCIRGLRRCRAGSSCAINFDLNLIAAPAARTLRCVLQCVLQRVAVYCRVLQFVVMRQHLRFELDRRTCCPCVLCCSLCCSVCCSALRCVATCCSMLQRVAACCSMLQHVAACCSVIACVHYQLRFELDQRTCCPYVLCCSVLQRVAVCCGVLQCVAVCCSVSQCIVAHSCTVLQSFDKMHVDTYTHIRYTVTGRAISCYIFIYEYI